MNKILNRVFYLLNTIINRYFTLGTLCIFAFCTLLEFRINAYKCILLMKNFTATYLKLSFTFRNDFSIMPQRAEMIYWEFLNKSCDDHNWQQTFWRRVLTRVSDVANFWNGNLENHFAKGTGYPDWTLTPDYQGMQSEILVAKIRNQFWPNNRTELYKFSRCCHW